MFGTFYASLPASEQSQAQGGSSSAPSTPPNPPDATKPKRRQVARACDWCRVHRIKCDTEQPCRNCRARGGECSNNGTLSQVRTLPRAIREIESLRQKVRDLEGTLDSGQPERARQKSLSKSPAPQRKTRTSSRSSSTQRSLLSPSQHDEFAIGNTTMMGSIKQEIGASPLFPALTTSSSPQTQFYGPSSTPHFLDRVETHVRRIFGHSLPYQQTGQHPTKPGHSGAAQRPGHAKALQPAWNPSEPLQPLAADLNRAQESYFINLFCSTWLSWYQAVDENDLRGHLNRLWAETNAPREASSLVDIIVALGMQHALAVEPQDLADSTQLDVQDLPASSRWLFQRCQMIVTRELESPSVRTVQSQFLSALFLDIACRPTTALVMLTNALRTAEALGYHLEPPIDLPPAQRESRKCLWWTLVSYDSKLSIRLGRPWGAHLNELSCTCSLPTEDRRPSMHPMRGEASIDASSLAYLVQETKLMLATRLVHDAFQSTCLAVTRAAAVPSIYDDPRALETCAQALTESMRGLDAWADSLPPDLVTKRRGNGRPFSTDTSAMEIDSFAPDGIQRQRLLLEMQYHDLAMTLLRPCTAFPTPASTAAGTSSSASHAYRNAELAARHAMATTHMLHQILSETNLLNGWREPLNAQWNATLTIAGFVLAYPHGSAVTNSACETLPRCLDVLETLGSFFTDAGPSASVARDLIAKAEQLVSSPGGPTGTGAAVPEHFGFGIEPEVQQFQGYANPPVGSGDLYDQWSYGMMGHDGPP